MPHDFFELGAAERKEAFDVAGDTSGRPPQLLEKDVWVVWTLRALFESHLAADLTFKGGDFPLQGVPRDRPLFGRH